MPRPGTLEICRKYLYEDADNIPEAYRARVMRVRVGFSYWYEFPTKTRSDVRDHISSEFKTSGRTAYEDIQIIETLLGNIKNPEKAWMRYRVNAMIEEAYSIAEENNDVKGMVYAADKLGKYNQLDQPDADPIPFEDIVPQPFEPTDDPSGLGVKKDPDIRKKKKKMLEKYMSEIEIIDVPYEEMMNNAGNNDEESEA